MQAQNQKTVRDVCNSMTQEVVDAFCANFILPAIVRYLKSSKNVDVTVEELVKALMIPAQQVQAHAQQPLSLGGVNIGPKPSFLSGGGNSTVSKASSRSSNDNRPKSSEATPETFNDGYVQGGCLYIFSRGDCKFIFCGNNPESGQVVCSNCKNRNFAKQLSTEYYQGTLNVDDVRNKNQMKFREWYQKQHGGTKPSRGSKGGPNGIGGNPLVQPPPGQQATPNFQATEYFGEGQGKELYWIPQYNLVVSSITGPSGSVITVQGIATTKNTPMRKLTEDEAKNATNLRLSVNPECIEKQNSNPLGGGNNLFSNPPQQQGGNNLFSNPPQQQGGNNLFSNPLGGNPPQQQGGNNLFSNPPQQQGGNNLFSNPQQQGGNLFSNPQQQGGNSPSSNPLASLGGNPQQGNPLGSGLNASNSPSNASNPLASLGGSNSPSNASNPLASLNASNSPSNNPLDTLKSSTNSQQDDPLASLNDNNELDDDLPELPGDDDNQE